MNPIRWLAPITLILSILACGQDGAGSPQNTVMYGVQRCTAASGYSILEAEDVPSTSIQYRALRGWRDGHVTIYALDDAGDVFCILSWDNPDHDHDDFLWYEDDTQIVWHYFHPGNDGYAYFYYWTDLRTKESYLLAEVKVNGLNSINRSPDGTKIILSQQHRGPIEGGDGIITIFDTEQREIVATINLHDEVSNAPEIIGWLDEDTLIFKTVYVIHRQNDDPIITERLCQFHIGDDAPTCNEQ